MAGSNGFQGTAYYIIETAWGAGIPANPALKRWGNLVTEVKVGYGRDKEPKYSIEDLDPQDLLDKTKKVTLSVTYVLQRKDSLDDLYTRNADKTCKSRAVEIGIGTAASAADYYLTFVGCKGSFKVKVVSDDYVMVTETYKCKSVTGSTTPVTLGTGSKEAALNTTTYPYAKWSGATVTKGGSPWGYITAGFELEVDNKITVEPGLGADTPGVIGEGERLVKGSGDLYVEDGGVNQFTDVDGSAGSTIVLNAGSTGAPKFTLTDCEFGDFNLTLDNKAGKVKTAMPFIARTGLAIAVV